MGAKSAWRCRGGQIRFIHEKLDIKILILFILSRLPGALSGETLADLVLCDEGISYFDYAECLSELIETGHVTQSDGKYSITEKGIRNGAAIESSLPYTVRVKAERSVTAVATGMKRDSMIKTSHEDLPGQGCMVSLSLSDGVGEIITMRLISSGEEQARRIEDNFRLGAESYYNRIIGILSE
jgi:predicted transcriptional regulator